MALGDDACVDRLPSSLSQQRYQRLVDNLGDWFVIYSRDVATSKLRFLSRGFEAVFGIPVSAALGKHVAAVIDWCAGVPELMERNVAALVDGTAKIYRAEYSFVHPDGGVRTLLITSHLANDETGALVTEGIAEDITEKKALEARLRELATIDPLTALLNRREILGRLDAELSRARRYSRPLSVLIVDLDHFKAVNDSYGHLAGDSVLTAFAALLRSQLRGDDHAGRYGGEEFLVILSETSSVEARDCAERIRKGVEGLRIESERGLIKATVSIGVAYLRGDAQSATDLLSKADDALYRAKAAGRNRVRLS